MPEETARQEHGAPAWERLRDDFPALDQDVHGHPLVYLDNAATSQKPRVVIDAIRHYYERDNSNVHRGIHELSNRATAAYEGARERAAEFLNAPSPLDIVFTRNTTESINLVASTWGLENIKGGDKILLTEMEHHSNMVPWQILANKTGAKLTYLPVTGDDGLLQLDRLDEFLTPEVKLFAFTHISNTLGTVNPVGELCAKARQLGVVTLVDGAQSSGHCPVDVADVGCDFYAFSGHKMCGPTGVGILYGRQELLEEMPPYQGGGEMISSVDYFRVRWNTVPHKFEAGTPNIVGAVGIKAAMDYIEAVGREKIAKHDTALAGYCFERIAALPGTRVLGPPPGSKSSPHAGMVSFLIEGVHAHDIVTLADQSGVALRGGHHCNQPLMRRLGIQSTARASFYFYNRKEEVDRLIEVLEGIQAFFGGRKG